MYILYLLFVIEIPHFYTIHIEIDIIINELAFVKLIQMLRFH